MNLQNISIEEIMGLSKKTEAEQKNMLLKYSILQYKQEEFHGSSPKVLVYPESLPDLADRLFRDIKIGVDVHHLYAVYVQLFEVELINDSDYINFYRWWALDALPIHRIQAALLALKRAGEEGR